ncbi:MAG: AEC family transporter [Actinomycetia bacterium]|nr:AEC family transporter [Actinomycetes bacterium]
MSIAALASVIFGVLGYVAIGVALRLTGMLSPNDAKPLNTVLIYVALPALVFTTVQPAEVSLELVAIPALGWVIAVSGLALAWVCVRLLKLQGAAAGAFLLAAAFGNTGYIGYPVASALLGDPGLVRAIFYDIFGNTAAIVTIGSMVASRFGEHGLKVNPIKEIVTFPPFIALAVALVLRSVPVPSAVMDWLGVLGKLVVPLIMVSVGLSLQPGRLREHLPVVSAIAAIKLLVLPLLAWGLGTLLLADPASVRVLVLEAGVPSMMLTVVVGTRFRLDVDLIASAILVTTVGAIVTIPLLQVLVG